MTMRIMLTPNNRMVLLPQSRIVVIDTSRVYVTTTERMGSLYGAMLQGDELHVIHMGTAAFVFCTNAVLGTTHAIVLEFCASFWKSVSTITRCIECALDRRYVRRVRKRLAFAMALHWRLGSASRASIMGSEPFELIGSNIA